MFKRWPILGARTVDQSLAGVALRKHDLRLKAGTPEGMQLGACDCTPSTYWQVLSYVSTKQLLGTNIITIARLYFSKLLLCLITKTYSRYSYFVIFSLEYAYLCVT